MNLRSPARLVAIACWAALVSLGLMVWSLFDPRPIPVVVAMSVGQAIGTASLGLFVLVVVADLRARLAARGAAPSSDEPPREP